MSQRTGELGFAGNRKVLRLIHPIDLYPSEINFNDDNSWRNSALVLRGIVTWIAQEMDFFSYRKTIKKLISREKSQIAGKLQ